MTVITTIMAVVVCLISLNGSGMEWKGSQTITDKCVFSEDDNDKDWYLSSLSSLYSSHPFDHPTFLTIEKGSKRHQVRNTIK